MLANRYGLTQSYTNGVTPYDGETIGNVHGVLKNQLGPLVDLLGPGIIQSPDASSFEVSEGGGLDVDVAPGVLIAASSTLGSVVLQLPETVTVEATASDTSYIFAVIQTSGGNDSRFSGLAQIVVNDTDEYDGGELLARVVADGSGVTEIEDLRQLSPVSELFARGLKWQDDWDSERSYGVGDIAKHSSSLWLSVVPNSNSEPEEGNANWQSMGSATGGTTWRDGAGEPDDDTGTDGDFYLDSATGNYYKRVAGAYELRGSLRGLQGLQGYSLIPGLGDPASDLGVNGDSYLDLGSLNLFTKSAGAWTLRTNIKGEPGEPGADGTDGADGAPGVGLNPVDGEWEVGESYETDDLISHNGNVYRVLTDHTATADDEPGVGLNQATYWALFLSKGTDGAAWNSGSGTPSNGLGVDGDWYFDYTNFRFYHKESGAYVLKTLLPIYDPRLIAVTTSSTSVSIGTGTKTLTNVTTARSFVAGMRLRAAVTGDVSKFIEGVVSSYAGSTLVLTVDLTGGSGSSTSWTIGLAGEPGVQGEQGEQGEAGETGPAGADGESVEVVIAPYAGGGNAIAVAEESSDLGTGAFENIPESGDAADDELVLGADSRLLDDNLFLDLAAESSPLVLSTAQCRARNVYLQGSLDEDFEVEFLNLNRTWNITDLTTRNGHTIAVRKTGGSDTTVTAGESLSIYATGS